MKNILIIVTKGEVGGAQKMVSELAHGLRGKGHTVTIGIGIDGPVARQLAADGFRIVRFAHLNHSRNPFTNLRFVFEMWGLVNKEKFDAVQINSSNALFGAIGAKLSRHRPRTIFTFHGLSFLDPGHRTFLSSGLYRLPFRLFYTALFRILLMFVDEKVFVSGENMHTARSLGLVTRGNIIPNGVNAAALHFLPGGDARKRLEELCEADFKGSFLLGSIGRLAYPKNYEFLIEHFADIRAALPGTRLALVGDGPLRAKYEELIRAHNLEHDVFLVGERMDAASLLKGFDAFVLPSLYEGMSLTLIEALQAGRAIIAADVGGNREVLGDAGFVYPSGNLRGFIKALRSLREDTDLRKRTEARAAERGQEFTSERMVESYARLLETPGN